MNRMFVSALGLTLFAAVPAFTQTMEVSPNGSRPTARGPAQNFTGQVLVDPLFAAKDMTHATGGQVTFAPGARSAWHSHPAGQMLIVTAGTGWIQGWDGEKREIRPGDVVWTPPGVKHWHGATATNDMTHIAIQENVDGRNVDWMEQVSDEQYAAASVPTRP